MNIAQAVLMFIVLSITSAAFAKSSDITFVPSVALAKSSLEFVRNSTGPLGNADQKADYYVLNLNGTCLITPSFTFV